MGTWVARPFRHQHEKADAYHLINLGAGNVCLLKEKGSSPDLRQSRTMTTSPFRSDALSNKVNAVDRVGICDQVRRISPLLLLLTRHSAATGCPGDRGQLRHRPRDQQTTW